MAERSEKKYRWILKRLGDLRKVLVNFFVFHGDLIKGLDKAKRTAYIAGLNQELESSDGFIEPHYDLITRSLDSVSHLSEHEDDKATRRLTAMVFIGAAFAALSAVVLSPTNNVATPHFASFAPQLIFSYYILCLVGGTITLYALLPHYNIDAPNADAPRSIIFAPEIDRVTGKNWVRPFIQNQKDQLRELVARQNLGEIRLISQITVWKMKLHAVAGGYFLLALALFFGMATFFGFEKMSHTKPTSVVFVLDADNTLWDTDALYRNAQLELLSAVEDIAGHEVSGDRLDFVRQFDQQIAKSDAAGFRYQPYLLANRLYHELRADKGLAPEEINEATKSRLIAAIGVYLQRLNDKPTLKWTPKTGQVGSIIQPSKTEPHVQKTTAA